MRSRAPCRAQGIACWRKESAAAAPCGERERAKARDGYAPTARCGTGLWRVTGRGAGLLDDSSADVGFSAGWLGADAARLASDALGAGLLGADAALPVL